MFIIIYHYYIYLYIIITYLLLLLRVWALIISIEEEHLQPNNKKPNNLIKIWAKDMNFCEEDQMDSKHLKRWSTGEITRGNVNETHNEIPFYIHQDVCD